MKRKILSICLLALILCTCVVQVFATDSSSTNTITEFTGNGGQGKIRVLYEVDDKQSADTEKQAGVSILIYKVANITDDLKPVVTDEFTDWRSVLKFDLTSNEKLQELSTEIGNCLVKASSNNKPIKALGYKTTGTEGIALFDGLDDGIYYLLPADVYTTVGTKQQLKYISLPALVVLPYTDNETHTLVREANIELKHNLPIATPTPKPVVTPKPSTTGSSNKTTGMLQWPIMVMGIAGAVLAFSTVVLILCNRKNTKKWPRVLGIVVLVVCLLLEGGAVSLFIHNQEIDKQAGEKSSALVSALDSSIKVKKQAKTVSNTVNEEELDPNREMPTMEIDGVKYIGKLRIPALNLELPVVAEWSDSNAEIGPCLDNGTVYKNNMVIAGHNYQSHFGSLSDIRENDSVEFEDVDGNVYNYRVSYQEIVGGFDVDKMLSYDKGLTLYTCTYDGNDRVTVRCARE